VYFRKYEENGLYFQELYDPSLLSVFGLSPSASPEDIKRRFRELAKKYHPDLGGSSEKMIELLEAYHKLQDS
jgi:curved DNA-binding protein CbpA